MLYTSDLMANGNSLVDVNGSEQQNVNRNVFFNSKTDYPLYSTANNSANKLNNTINENYLNDPQIIQRTNKYSSVDYNNYNILNQNSNINNI